MNLESRLSSIEQIVGDGTCATCRDFPAGATFARIEPDAPATGPTVLDCPACGRRLARFDPITLDGGKVAA
jgi:hypothetical protein